MPTLLFVTLMTLWNTQQPSFTLIRGPYGEPHIFSDSAEAAFEGAGYAVAQDRLYQMDISRRSARGKLSELIGRAGVGSDRDALRFGYTDSEYETIFKELPPEVQSILQAYARGVNRWIDEAASSGKLPEAYAGQKPEPWTPTDSLSIGVRLVRSFGRFGAGELRNLALYTYLKNRLGDEALAAMDDLAWQNDSSAICTVSDSDDPLRGTSPFEPFDESVTRAHVSLLPPVNLLELLPAIRMEEQAEMKEIAAQLGVPHKWGSYAVVVSKQKSRLGVPLLLSGPQMGFSTPSIVHQMSITCPQYTAVGMDVPGIPGILIGHSPTVAWGMTSGVADTDDVFFVRLNPQNPDEYNSNGKWKRFERTEWQLSVKDGEPVTAVRELTDFGPVILKSVGTGVAYVRKSPLWMKEVAGLAGMTRLPNAKTISEVRQIALTLNANFNLFAATTEGDIGWFFCGRVPLRSNKVDPRLPAPMDKEHDWKGVLPPEKMPYVINPSSGWIANWNNKPVSWWPNLDTPAWGRIFRNEAIVQQLESKDLIGPEDLEAIVRNIATMTTEPKYFLPDLLAAINAQHASDTTKTALAYLHGWNGTKLDGEVAPVIYQSWLAALRRELFLAKLGNFVSPDVFNLVLQPTVVWNALHGKTRIDYLNGRSPADVMRSAFENTIGELERTRGSDVSLWRLKASQIQFNGLPPVLYDDRGTYIQIVELWRAPRGRFVAPPGVSENRASPHFADQRDLAAQWTYFPMLYKRDDFPKQ